MLRVSLFTLVALLAFAANSVLCRLALKTEQVAPLDFSTLRILAAAITLGCIVCYQHKSPLFDLFKFGSFLGATSLFIYIVGFSFAYVSLGTATGALILFSSVQATMLLMAKFNGKQFSIIEIVGIVLSVVGLIYFVLPQLNQPDIINSVYMMGAGIAWGAYSLIGASSVSPLKDTAGNFIRLVPFALFGALFIVIDGLSEISPKGAFYSALSGSLASGIGYAIWYWVLPKLTKSMAAVSQLSVPIWAAIGGIMFINETISWHLVLSAVFILGGIIIVLVGEQREKH